MSSYRQNNEEEEEEEEELDETDYKSQKDAVLFAIDVSKSMLEPPPKGSTKKGDKDTPISAALKCAYEIMKQRIIASPKDMMGILFFGTESSKFQENALVGSGYPHCYLFMDLDIPDAEDVRNLRGLAEENDDPDGILTPSSEPVNMANMLFCANQVFTMNAANFGSRRLFIITDNDDPVGGDKTARQSAAVRAKDLYDLGVIIELFPISTGGKEEFNLKNFYEDIVYRSPAAEEGDTDHRKLSRSGDGLTLLNSLKNNINSKQTPKRAYFSRMPFEIAPNLTISVKGYIPLHSQVPARSCFVFLDGETKEVAKGETTQMDSDSARTVEKDEIKKAYKFGGEYVYFTPEETKKLKQWGDPVLRIIGFKPRSSLPLWASVKKSLFIFPSEEDYVGSTRVFSALWKKLLKDNKVALAWLIARKNGNPILVAIMPSRPQSDDESGTNFLPEGLWLYTLPFADDLREPPMDERHTAEAPRDVVEKMTDVIENLQLPKGIYNPTKYPNPALQWHYKILQVLALEDEVPPPDPDLTVPKYKKMADRVGSLIEEINDDIQVAANEAAHSRSRKREADDDEEEDVKPAKKKSRATPAAAASGKKGGGLSNKELKAAFEADTLKKMVVAELKDILTSKGVSTSGKKADLVERLEEWIEANT